MATRVSSFSLREPDDTDVIAKSNETALAVDLSRSVVDLFYDRARSSPNAVACIDGETQTTFEDLNQTSNRIAHALLERGVGVDVPVGILLERSALQLAAMLGILKAGGCYVPIDPRYPADYVRLVVADASPRVVLSTEALRPQLQGASAEVLSLDAAAVRHAATDAPSIRISPEQLAYIMYTSGSSGTPKGVMVPHRQILNCLTSLWTRAPFGEGEVVAQKTSAAFAISTKELYSGLLAGAPQVFLDDDVARDPARLVAELARTSVTRLYTFPSQLEALIASARGAYDRLRSLRHVFVSIEPWSADLLNELRRVMPWVTPWYIYGCTEINDVTYCDPGCKPSSTGFVPIGRPIHNTRVLVFDEDLRPVPVGATGEMYVESLGLARGYWNLPTLTAERFIANPLGGSARLYRTGDLARYLPDGSLEFLGRRDEEIKVRGYRVDVRQVEKALAAHPAVREAAVVGKASDGKGKSDLIAYVVPASEDAQSIEGLREYMTNCLPAYMVPTIFQTLPVLPRLPNDKIDRLRLPDPTRADAGADYVAPRSPTETALAQVWVEVLRQGTTAAPVVGLRHDFFDLGGHSLLAAQMFSRIRELLGVELPLNLLFENPVLEAFARAVDTALSARGARPETAIVAVDRAEKLPLSFVQERLWFVHEHMPEQRTSYNVAFAADMRGKGFSIAALRAAINGIVARHETLRTTFVVPQDASEPAQRIADSLWLDIPLEDVAEAAIESKKAEHAAHVFDLAKGPLLKVSILRVSPEHHVFMLNMHHIICDGWSIGIMMRDMWAFYAAAETGAQPKLPPLDVQYADYVVWQRQQDLRSGLEYWKGSLEGYEEGLSLPYDFPRPRGRAWRAGLLRHRYAPELSAKLAEMGKRQQTTLFMTLTASVAILLHRYTRRDDLCIGTTVAGRDLLALENLVGFFVNILALRLDLTGDPTLETILGRTKAQLLAGMEHRDVPFEHVLGALKKQPDSSQIPLVPVMVRHQNFPNDRASASTNPDLQTGEIEFGQRTTPNELDLQFTGDGSALELTIEYAEELFSEKTIARLIETHEHILSLMVSSPAVTLSDLPLHLGQAGAERGPGAALDVSKSVLSLFRERVAENPDAPACIGESGSLTFAELDRRANQVAHALVASGVRSETPVGILLHRSPELLIATLGVLKSGGCYVPLDPQYPQEYVAQILADAEPSVVLTSPQLRSKAAGSGRTLLALDDAAVTSSPTSAPEVQVRADQLAYLMYTSGSTGAPKGVMVPHQQLLTWLYPLWERAPFEGGELVAQKTSTAFAIAVKESFAGLLAGVPQLAIDDATVKDVASLVRTLERWEVSRLYTFPSQLEAILAHVEDRPERLKALRHLFVSIEPCPVELLRKVRTLAPWITPWYIYGCTEINDVTYCEPDEQVSSTGFVPIGRPISRVRTFVLDDELREAPVGSLGELYVESPGAARGYWRQPGLTAERFVPNPYGQPGSRLYRTGDLARYLDDGSLEFLGRRDHETKIRGHRVDIRHVEKVLGAHPAVAEVAVLGWPRQATNPQLLAYVVFTGNQSTTARELREYLLANLPTYMVPALYQFLDELPRLTNGKLDRLALPEPSELQGRAEYVSPRSPTEQRIAAMWSRLLTHGDLPPPQVGGADNFFDLGGHSLLAEHVLSFVRREFGVDVGFRTLFESPRLEDFASAVDGAVAARTDSKRAPSIKEPSAVVSLSKSSSLPSLFCVHPVGGQALVYRELAQSLGSHVHVWALQSEAPRPCKTLEALAEFYAGEIRKVQSRGSYRLLGWSSGGLLASAIARALLGQDSVVDYLGLIETNPIPSLAAGRNSPLIAATNLLGSVRGRSFTAPELDAARDLLASKGGVESAFTPERAPEALRALSQRFEVTLTEESLTYVVSRLDTTRYYLGLLAGHRVEDVADRVVVYRAKNAIKLAATRPTDVIVPGNHYDVLQGENARYLGARITERLATLGLTGVGPNQAWHPAQT
ncbi:MAG: amino acid adenylation domain-containing protein [Myxococcales bacterium]|nr:MAG: amino acid adenylation domain-containing protein [Myxococcales bacterium]